MDHTFSTYAQNFPKISSPLICQWRLFIRGLENIVFRKFCVRAKWFMPLQSWQRRHLNNRWNSLKHLSDILRAFLSLTFNMNVAQCFSVFNIDFEQFFYCWISPVPVGKHLFRVNNNDRIKSCSSSWNSSVSSFDGVFYIDDIFPIKTGISVFHAYP